jgi:hypothetical protein
MLSTVSQVLFVFFDSSHERCNVALHALLCHSATENCLRACLAVLSLCAIHNTSSIAYSDGLE